MPVTDTEKADRPQRRRARRTMLDLDWQPEPITGRLDEALAHWTDEDFEREFDRFRSYKLHDYSCDWDAAWRYWLSSHPDAKTYHPKIPPRRFTLIRGGRA